MANLYNMYTLAGVDIKAIIKESAAEYARDNKDKLTNRKLIEAYMLAETQIELDIVNELTKYSESWLMNGN